MADRDINLGDVLGSLEQMRTQKPRAGDYLSKYGLTGDDQEQNFSQFFEKYRGGDPLWKYIQRTKPEPREDEKRRWENVSKLNMLGNAMKSVLDVYTASQPGGRVQQREPSINALNKLREIRQIEKKEKENYLQNLMEYGGAARQAYQQEQQDRDIRERMASEEFSQALENWGYRERLADRLKGKSVYQTLLNKQREDMQKRKEDRALADDIAKMERKYELKANLEERLKEDIGDQITLSIQDQQLNLNPTQASKLYRLVHGDLKTILADSDLDNQPVQLALDRMMNPEIGMEKKMDVVREWADKSPAAIEFLNNEVIGQQNQQTQQQEGQAPMQDMRSQGNQEYQPYSPTPQQTQQDTSDVLNDQEMWNLID